MERNKALERKFYLGCLGFIAVACLGITYAPQIGEVIDDGAQVAGEAKGGIDNFFEANQIGPLQCGILLVGAAIGARLLRIAGKIH